MKSSFLNFKIMVTIFLILLTVILMYLSNEPTPEIKEVTKEVKLVNIVK